MRDHGIAKEAIRIFFGPAISAASYYFESIDPMQRADPRWSPYIERIEHDEHKEHKGHGDGRQCYHIDLQGRVLADLEERAHLRPSQLQATEIDTGADPDYFSHARSHRATPKGLGEGRNGIVVKIR